LAGITLVALTSNQWLLMDMDNHFVISAQVTLRSWLSELADTMTVALGDTASAVHAGDEAVIFGSHLRGEPVLQEWADALGTVGEEIVVRVGSRAQREYRDS
jgi:hypothetical protein